MKNNQSVSFDDEQWMTLREVAASIPKYKKHNNINIPAAIQIQNIVKLVLSLLTVAFEVGDGSDVNGALFCSDDFSMFSLGLVWSVILFSIR